MTQCARAATLVAIRFHRFDPSSVVIVNLRVLLFRFVVKSGEFHGARAAKPKHSSSINRLTRVLQSVSGSLGEIRLFIALRCKYHDICELWRDRTGSLCLANRVVLRFKNDVARSESRRITSWSCVCSSLTYRSSLGTHLDAASPVTVPERFVAVLSGSGNAVFAVRFYDLRSLWPEQQRHAQEQHL